MKTNNIQNNTIIEMKNLVNKILKEEQELYNIEGNNYPITIIEYYKSDVFKKNLFLSKSFTTKIAVLEYPYKYKGFYQPSNTDIYVFIKSTNKVKKINQEKTFINLIRTTYHEFRHRYQQSEIENSENLSFELFAQLLEERVRSFNRSDYNLRHNQYYTEIDANLYGVDKTLNYLKKHNILSEEDKSYLETKRKQFEVDLLEYDFQSFFQKFNRAFQSKKIDFPFFATIFYDENRKFKSVSEILDNPNIDVLDARILVHIFSSPDFLKNIDFTNLSSRDKEIIMKSITTTYNEELTKRTKRNKLFHQGFISSRKWLKYDNLSSNKIRYCLQIIELLEYDINKTINTKSVKDYYESAEEVTIPKKNIS